MNGVDLSKPDNTAIAQEIIILKITLLGCIGLGLIGLGVFTFYNHQSGIKSQQQATGKPEKIKTSTKPSEPPLF